MGIRTSNSGDIKSIPGLLPQLIGNRPPSCAVRSSTYYGGRQQQGVNSVGTVNSTRYMFGTVFACHSLQVMYGNYYRDSNATGGTVEKPNTNSIAVKAALEVDGVIYPLFFAGKRTVTIDAGGLALTDPLGLDLPADKLVYVRTVVTIGTSEYAPIMPMTGASAGGPDTWALGVDYADSGTFTTSGQYVGQQFGPLGLLGYPSDTIPKPVIAIVGDSITYGSGDLGPHNANMTPGGGGAIVRALGGDYAYMCAALGSDAAKYLSGSGFLSRLAAISGCTHAVVGYGRNDLPGSTLVSVQTALTALWSRLRARGMRVYQCTIVPKTTADASAWGTVAGQTSDATEALRRQVNAWIRTCPAPLSGYFEFADLVEPSRDSGVWKAGPVLKTGTATGGSTTTLVDTAGGFTANQYASDEYMVRIVSGTGAGQCRAISNNTTTQLNLRTTPAPNAAWDTAPDATSVYEIFTRWTYDGVHGTIPSYIAMAAAIDPTLFTL